MLGVLPPEIILSILCYLPIQQLQRLCRVSKPWRCFMKTNKENIFHAAAILHGFIPSRTKTIDSAPVPKKWSEDIHTWSELCTCSLTKLKPPADLTANCYQVINFIRRIFAGKAKNRAIHLMWVQLVKLFGVSRSMKSKKRSSPLISMEDSASLLSRVPVRTSFGSFPT